MPGGSFDRTYANSGDGGTGEADPASVSGFRLDKYSVTVARFRQFVTAWNNGSGYLPADGSGKHAYLNGGMGLMNSGAPGTYEAGWSAANDSNVAPTTTNLDCAYMTNQPTTWTASPGANDNRPMNCVNWYEAYAFCIWDGGFLPSDAEWGYAAAGGSEQREYPWGSTPPGMANQYEINDCYYPSGSHNCTGIANIAPVGTATLGVGKWGQLDLLGDVMQWVLDVGGTNKLVDPCSDCAYTSPPNSGFVLRGGSYYFGSSPGSSATRGGDISTVRDTIYGFRCARAP